MIIVDVAVFVDMSAGRRNLVTNGVLAAYSIIEFSVCRNGLAVYLSEEVSDLH